MRAGLERLAPLFVYPDERYKALALAAPELAAAIEGYSTEKIQELFVGTFDMNPDGAPDIGWHLYGENYDRGEFLVKLRGEMRRYGIPESTELPDHLSHVLPLVARMPEPEAGEFAKSHLLPALEKMLASLEGKQNPFEKLLRTVKALAETALPVAAGRES